MEAFAAAGKELVFVGNWDRSEYSRGLKTEFEKYANIHFINSEYNLDRLYALRANCAWYIHGHSAGGTNPSLVEAMFLGDRFCVSMLSIIGKQLRDRLTTGRIRKNYSRCWNEMTWMVM